MTDLGETCCECNVIKDHPRAMLLLNSYVKLWGCIQKFSDWVVTKYTLTIGITRWEATQRVIAAKLTRLTHKIGMQLHLVKEICTVCSSRSRWPVRKLLDTPSYFIMAVLRSFQVWAILSACKWISKNLYCWRVLRKSFFCCCCCCCCFCFFFVFFCWNVK